MSILIIVILSGCFFYAGKKVGDLVQKHKAREKRREQWRKYAAKRRANRRMKAK